MNKIKVVIIGAGNVSTAFASYMSNHKDKIELLSIYSRSEDSIISIKKRLGLSVDYLCDINKIDIDADIYLFCVSDDSLEDVLSKMPKTKGIWIHTSGCNHIDMLKCYHDRVGVLYPLQSISKNNIPDPNCVKVFIEANSETVMRTVESFANILFDNVNYADSYQRRALHLAAVFACNFTNHMYAISRDILEYFHLPEDALTDLIQYTAKRVEGNDPNSLQTGPAVREDKNTISIHKKLMLNANSNVKDMYDLITKSIIDKKYNRDINYFINKNE